MAKVNRFGQATVLTPQQLNELWAELDQPYRLIAQICYYTAARSGEVLSLEAGDIAGNRIIFRSSKTKTKVTCTALMPDQLGQLIKEAKLPTSSYLFPSAGKRGYVTRQALDKQVERAAGMIGVEGVSTRSFRRSQATHLHQANVPLRAIQRITGHSSLASLERYLDIGSAEAFQSQQLVMAELFSA